jgi:hypothetical protein
VEDQNANEMTDPDYVDSEVEFVKVQNVCGMVDQEDVNSEDKCVLD